MKALWGGAAVAQAVVARVSLVSPVSILIPSATAPTTSDQHLGPGDEALPAPVAGPADPQSSATSSRQPPGCDPCLWPQVPISWCLGRGRGPETS